MKFLSLTFSRIIMMLQQLTFFLFILHQYGESTAGLLSVTVGIASTIILFFSFSITRFISIGFKYHSLSFFYSISTVSLFYSFFIFLFIFLFYSGVSLFLVLIFFIKAFDYYNEINSVVYRKKDLELEFFKMQVLRAFVFLLIAFISHQYGLSINQFLFVLMGSYFVLFIVSIAILDLNKKFIISYKSFLYYGRFLKFGWKSSINSAMSTLSSNSPKFALAYFGNLEAVAVFTILSYVYTSFCTFFSMLIQILISKQSYFLREWSKNTRVFWKVSVVYFLFFLILEKYVVKILVGFVDEKWHSDISSSFIYYILLVIPLTLRDLIGYYALNLNKVGFMSLCTFFSLVLFWILTYILGEEISVFNISMLLISLNSLFVFLSFFRIKEGLSNSML